MQKGRTLAPEVVDVLEVRVVDAQAIRFGVRVEGSRYYNAVLLLEGMTASGKHVRGIGESSFRSRRPGKKAKASWGKLVEDVSGLAGTELVFRLGDSLLDSVRSQVHKIVGEEGREPGFEGLRLGAEMALLDLVADALDCSVASLLAEGRETTGDDLVKIPFLPVRGGPHSDAVARIQEAGFTAEDEVWLDFGCRFNTKVASAWVDQLEELVDEGVAQSFVEYRPLRPVRLNKQGFLSDKARKTLGKVSVAWDVDHPNALSHDTSLGSSFNRVVVRPIALGSYISATRLIEELSKSGATDVYVAEDPAMGPVGSHAMRALIEANDNLKGVLVHVGTVAPEPFNYRTDLSWLLTAPAVRYAGTEPLIGERDNDFNQFEELPYLQVLGPNGTKGHLMERQALALGMDTVRYSKGAFTASDRKNEPVLFKWSRTPLSSAVALSVCTHKEATRMLLSRAGVPTPRGRTFANGDWATGKEFADLIGFPVVVKPAMGVRGIGVVADIKSQHELDMALQQLSDSKLGSQDFIVEKHITGKDYRIVVVGDEVVAAILREPAQVVGDGKHTVTELILKKNAQRRLNPHLWGRPIVYDAASVYQLERLGLTPQDVPEDGQVVVLSNSSSLSQGGESFDVLDELHPTIVQACVDAVNAVPNLEFCGVDFFIEDHTRPLDEQDAAIVELNAHAAIGNCEYPLYGQPRQVARELMKLTAEKLDLDVPDEPAETLTLRSEIRGKVLEVGYQQWFARLARSYGIDGWIQPKGGRALVAELSGETKAVSALVAAAALGPARAFPTSVTTTHIDVSVPEGFVIKRAKPRDLVTRPKRALRSAKRRLRKLKRKLVTTTGQERKAE